MALTELLPIVAAGILLAVVACIDVRSGRIPNWLTLPSILAGMAILSVKCIYGYPVWTAALTAGVSLALTYLLWFTGSWGGGDAKACLGALLLVSPAFPVLLFIIAFSSGLALIVAVRWMYRLTDSKNRHRHDSGGRQLGPSLLAAFILSAGACSVLSGGS